MEKNQLVWPDGSSVSGTVFITDDDEQLGLRATMYTEHAAWGDVPDGVFPPPGELRLVYGTRNAMVHVHRVEMVFFEGAHGPRLWLEGVWV